MPALWGAIVIKGQIKMRPDLWQVSTSPTFPSLVFLPYKSDKNQEKQD